MSEQMRSQKITIGYWLIPVFLMIIFSLSTTQKAVACSGGAEPSPTTLNTLVEGSEYIVKASVIETDRARKNAILSADFYLTGGSGPKLFLLYQTDPALSSVFYGHAYDTGCLYGGNNRPLSIGMTAYFFITRSSTGHYSLSQYGGFIGYATFPNDYFPFPQRADAILPDDYDNLKESAINNEADFIERIAEISDESTTYPTNNPPPRLTPLQITTDTGSHYIFPIDGGEPILMHENILPIMPQWSMSLPGIFLSPKFCAVIDCRLNSPDRSLFATQIDENTIEIDYPYSSDAGSIDSSIQIKGDAFSFSPIGETLLVWADNQLTIYAVTNNFCNCMYGQFVPSLQTITEIILQNEETQLLEDFYGKAIWSEDGSTVAYEDKNGIWTLDLYHQTQPELTVSSNPELLHPLFLSPTGRYLAFTENPELENWVTLDRVSGIKYENAIISPTERFMVQVAAENPIPRGDVIGCRLPMIEGCGIGIINRPHYLSWVRDDTVAIATCNIDNEQQCELRGYVVQNEFVSNEDYLFVAKYDGWLGDITYEPEQGILAYVTNPKAIRLDKSGGVLDYDLSEILDGEIVDIEWMSSLFY
jgi:hypothetical protein